MSRGNQREKAREKNLKEAAGKGKKNALSGSELAKSKEDAAKVMREKQAKADAKKAEASGTKK